MTMMTFEERIQEAMKYFIVKPTLRYEIDNVATVVAYDEPDLIEPIREELKKRIDYKEPRKWND